MANDQAPQAPDAGGGISLSTLPTWAYFAIGGLLLGGYLLWRKHSAGASPASLQDPGLIPSVARDPSTGLPLDPSTGLPFLTSQPSQQTGDNSTWLQSAEAAAKSLGYAPSLVQQALYDFLNGNPLNNREAGVINTLLGKIGYPPVLIPFLGTPPSNVPRKPTTKPKAGYAWTLVNNVWRQVRYASQDRKPPKKPVVRKATPIIHPRPILWLGPNAPRPHVTGFTQRPLPIPTPPGRQPHLIPSAGITPNPPGVH